MNLPAELRFVSNPTAPGFSFLSWDTEGGVQTKLNLLRKPTGHAFQVMKNEKWIDGTCNVMGTEAKEGQATFRLGTDGKEELLWTTRQTADGMAWSLRNTGGGGGSIRGVRLTLPFDPHMAATTVLPNRWIPPDGFALPAVLSAADFGQMAVRQQGASPVTGRFTGDSDGRIDITFEFQAPPAGEAVTLEFAPHYIPCPKGVDEATWKTIRRGWWNVFEPCVRGNLRGSGLTAPAGVLANNPISDPVSSLYAFVSDHAMLVPELAPGVSAEYLLRYSVDWWLDAKTDKSGAVVSYYDIKYHLDAPASVLVAAWACVEMSGDLKWAKARIGTLERIADFLASRDVDQDGIVESPKSGNANTFVRSEDRGATAWDTINSGHKEVWIESLVYRAFCCIADLEKRLKRDDKAKRYAELASRLRTAFYPTFYSPETHLLSWWISADGKRHDYWCTGMTGLPIAYGLVPNKEAESILSLIHAKVKEVGFKRLDLGLPCVLTPIRKADYHIGIGAVYGSPVKEDGSDTFQRYLNGACLVSDQIHWLNAHFRLGLGDKVRTQLDAMIARQAKAVFPNGGSFQNGIGKGTGNGAEYMTWTGEPCGYEGHLAYNWFFLQGALTKQPEYLRKIHRPMIEMSPVPSELKD